ncbi:MAG: sugar ABC transporter permease [Chloroflexota bacterium]|nr:MAG: sugar ABC transporter permease [Chloroflexota bacterium]
MAVTATTKPKKTLSLKRIDWRETLHLVKKQWSAYLFLSPWFILFMIFTVFSVSFSLYLSFHEWNIIEPDKQFIGLENYIRLFKDERFYQALWNTLLFTGFGVPLGLASGLIVALLLNTKVRGQGIFRTLFYIPVITPLVVSSVIWKWIYQGDYGLLNYYMLKFGLIKEKLLWLADPDLAMPSLIIMGIWMGTGGTMVLYLAGLQGIPEELYDSAKVDGANGLQRLMFVTIPLLAPTTFYILITSVIGSFQSFAHIYIMTNGGPLRRTTVIGFYLYETGFKHYEMGYASAMAYILFAIVFILTIVQMKFVKGDIQY